MEGCLSANLFFPIKNLQENCVRCHEESCLSDQKVLGSAPDQSHILHILEPSWHAAPLQIFQTSEKLAERRP